jgi:hypothetical protein
VGSLRTNGCEEKGEQKGKPYHRHNAT